MATKAQKAESPRALGVLTSLGAKPGVCRGQDAGRRDDHASCRVDRWMQDGYCADAEPGVSAEGNLASGRIGNSTPMVTSFYIRSGSINPLQKSASAHPGSSTPCLS
jgi:hypothetical protein